MGSVMSKNIEDLEKRLEKLVPLAQDALAAKILEYRQIVKRENSSAATSALPPIFGDAPSALPRSCCFASLSLGSAFAGAIVGAAAMFLGMTYFIQPRVEIREIVREVRVKAEPTIDVQAKPETKLAKSGSVNRSFGQPNAKKKWDERLALSDASFRDLDTLIAQRNALARQMTYYESKAGSTSSEFSQPRISPDTFRQLLRDLKL
jgi:hypothetical protein